MWDTIRKMEYRAQAKLPGAAEALQARLADRMELPLQGLSGEKLYLTGVTQLREKAAELELMYQALPEHRGVKDTILLDAWSSATIEGARTTVAQVRKSFDDPKTKDDRMVVNAIAGSNYAYGRPITAKNIRRLWERVVSSVCENEGCKGKLYRDGMVYIGNNGATIHYPAVPEKIPALMDQLFAFQEQSTEFLLSSFVAHFYFVYVHPFCDGNGRTARILNASYLYHRGYRKIKNLPLSSAINNQLSGYYSSLQDSEAAILRDEERWLDLSPFVSYMLDAFERCLIDAALAKNKLTDSETKVLERMNRVGRNAEITVAKASQILKRSESATRNVLNSLVSKGYLSVNTSQTPFVYRLQQHITN